MEDRAAHRTFYCPETPVHVDQVTFNLTNGQTGIVNAAKQTRDLRRLALEFVQFSRGFFFFLGGGGG